MDQIDSVLRRPLAYNNIDGVGELGIGFMCLSYSILGWLQIRSSEHSFWNRSYVLWICVVLMISIIHYGSKAIKNHITYPRTGRVEYRATERVWRPMILGGVCACIFSVTLALIIGHHWDLSRLVPLLGLGLAAIYAHGIARTVAWKWTVVWAMALASIVIALLRPDQIGAFATGSWITRSVPAYMVGAIEFTMLAFGTLLMISGAISFWLYLRNTEPPSDAE